MLGVSYKLRSAVRRPIKILALISSENGSYIARTQTLDLSDKGAKLQVDRAVSLPSHFQLTLSERGNVRRLCELVWRSATAAGVRFIDPKQLKIQKQAVSTKPAR